MENNIDKKETPKSKKDTNDALFNEIEKLFNYDIGQTVKYKTVKHNPYRNTSEEVILIDTIVGTLLHRDSLGYSMLYMVANNKNFINQKDIFEVVESGRSSRKK